MVQIERQLQTRTYQPHPHEQKGALLTADDVEKTWNIRATRDGAVLIPGQFNWKHQSIALGTVWELPPGVKPAWSSQFRGLGCEYVGPVLTASDPGLLEDFMNHPPKRKSVQQLAARV